MIVRGCSWKPRTTSVAWRTAPLRRTNRWGTQHLSGVTGCVNHHRRRASPWNVTPYQWAPLPETGHDLTVGALERKDYAKFVQFFRQASPYIEGHRGRTFVVVIPGEVILQRPLLQSQLKDIQLLHELGCRLVVVLGGKVQIDNYLNMRGLEPKSVGGYRITDADAMLAAMEAAGTSRMLVEAQLSKAPAVSVIRRHTRSSNSSDDFHFAPAMRVVSGNYVTSKRRGVVEGIDFGSTGTVRFVQQEAIHQQLDLGHVVLLSNLGYSASGEVLNCNTFDVATHAAIELKADKIMCITLDEVKSLRMPQWLSLNDAEALINERLAGVGGVTACSIDKTCPSLDGTAVPRNGSTHQSNAASNSSNGSYSSNGSASPPPAQLSNGGSRAQAIHEIELDLDCWQALNFPNALLTAVVGCKSGVKRAHLVDARQDGGLLLELYSRDGVGTMISTDFYEGIRQASHMDLEAIEGLLRPLTQAGVTKARSRESLMQDLHSFTVLERESEILACVLLQDLGKSADGMRCGELAAFCVHPSHRGSGRGDSLLDYVEQSARTRGLQRLVLLTTRTADWFMQRDFKPAGIAHNSNILPETRRLQIDPTRNSHLYCKEIVVLNDTVQAAPAGKRIGF
ncbi:hypothetical protein ABBQ38_004086 [Trebouxia sp. C0009 RCD-2024]